MKKLTLFLMVFVLSMFTAGTTLADDLEEPCATATPVPLDSSGRAEVTVNSGMTLEIEVPARGGLWVIDESWSGIAQLRNANCEVISSGSGREFLISAQVNAGTYYIEISEIVSSSIQIVFNEDDHGDDFASATTVSLDDEGFGTVSGTTDGGFDYDYFKITNPTPGILNASVSYDAFQIDANLPILKLYDSNHSLVADDFTSVTDDFISISTDVSPGDYFASVLVDPLYQYEYTLNVQFEWETGSLMVTIDPPLAVSAGARWKVDNGEWQTSGSTVTGLSVGSHLVEFDVVSDWIEPSTETVMITANQETSLAIDYTAEDGTPPQITDVLPVDGAGLDYAMRVPSDVSFAVRLSDEYGIDIAQADAVVFDIFYDGASTSQDVAYSRTTDDDVVRIVKLIDTEGDASVTDLWAVYDKGRELATDNGNHYPYDTTIGITVTTTDKYGNTVTSKVFRFKTETEDEHDNAADSANLPETTTQVGAEDSTVEVQSGNLEGAQLIYANEEPVKPGFGPEFDEVPQLDIANGVGWPLNLQPPTVFNEPVTILIPCIGYTDVSGLSIYYYDGTQWKLACDAAGNIQAGGEGWIVPGSRKDHNFQDDPINNDPSRIEIQVYHFSGLQVGANTPQTGSLTATITPQDAVDDGARWRVDGDEWLDSGHTVSNLSLGSHTVEFNDVTGWIAPGAQTVVVNDGQTATVTCDYAEDDGQGAKGDPSNPGSDSGGGGGCFIGLLVDAF